MSTQIESRPMNRERPSAHEVLLAGIGAVSLIRRNAGGALKEAIAIAGRVPEATSIMIEGLGETGGYYRDELLARANGLGKRATSAAGSFVADVESRVRPWLRRFDEVTVGLGITVLKPRSRQGSAKRAPAKRARKASKAVATRKPRKAA